MKNKEQLEHYVAKGHLINKKIQCNKCSVDITCFGSNLDSKISKFGSIEKLLENFICRSCVSASRPKKIVIKATKVSKKEKALEKTVDIPKMKFSIPRNVLLLDAPDIQKACSSNGNCLSPSFYLDHNKSCIGCAFIENCCSNLKNAA
jgi:hypothetical protein